MLDNLIDAELYQAVAQVTSQDFAFSYLVKARQEGKVVIPHTVVAWQRIAQNPYAMSALRRLGYALRKPERWHEGRDNPIRQRAA